MDLNDLLEQVNSKTTLLSFARTPPADFEDEQEKEAANPTPYLGIVQGPNGWCNHTVDGLLEQTCARARATSIITDKPMVAEQPSWRDFAEMLLAGKYYE